MGGTEAREHKGLFTVRFGIWHGCLLRVTTLRILVNFSWGCVCGFLRVSY